MDWPKKVGRKLGARMLMQFLSAYYIFLCMNTLYKVIVSLRAVNVTMFILFNFD